MIPGVIFTSPDASGRILQVPKTMLKLGGEEIGFEFKLPCWISLRPQSQIVVTRVQGLEDTVKEIFDSQGYNISIQSQIGNWDVRTIFLSENKPIRTKEDMQALLTLFRNQRKPLKAVDADGILNAAGISYIVIHSLDISPIQGRPHAFSITIGAYSELNSNISIADLMPEEGQIEAGEMA